VVNAPTPSPMVPLMDKVCSNMELAEVVKVASSVKVPTSPEHVVVESQKNIPVMIAEPLLKVPCRLVVNGAFSLVTEKSEINDAAAGIAVSLHASSR